MKAMDYYDIKDICDDLIEDDRMSKEEALNAVKSVLNEAIKNSEANKAIPNIE